MSEGDLMPREGDKVTFREDHCFVCGRENPIGLHLEFDLDHENQRAMSKVTFRAEHQGWDGVVHGGLLASVLDDVMAYALMTTGHMGITTRLNMVYRSAVHVGEKLYLEGNVEKLSARIATARGIGYTIDDKGGRIVRAEAEGTYFLDKPKHIDARETEGGD